MRNVPVQLEMLLVRWSAWSGPQLPRGADHASGVLQDAAKQATGKLLSAHAALAEPQVRSPVDGLALLLPGAMSYHGRLLPCALVRVAFCPAAAVRWIDFSVRSQRSTGSLNSLLVFQNS